MVVIAQIDHEEIDPILSTTKLYYRCESRDFSQAALGSDRSLAAFRTNDG